MERVKCINLPFWISLFRFAFRKKKQSEASEGEHFFFSVRKEVFLWETCFLVQSANELSFLKKS